MASLKKISRNNKDSLVHNSLHLYKLNKDESIEELDDELSQKNKLLTPKRPKDKGSKLMNKSINIDLAETKFVALQVSAYEQQTYIHNILSNEALSNLIQPNPGSVPMSPNSP